MQDTMLRFDRIGDEVLYVAVDYFIKKQSGLMDFSIQRHKPSFVGQGFMAFVL